MFTYTNISRRIMHAISKQSNKFLGYSHEIKILYITSLQIELEDLIKYINSWLTHP